MDIVLTGYMGTGKTSVANELHKILGWEIIDIDDLIVKQEGRSINDIFATNGEFYFRDVEAKVIEEVSKLDNKIISTGGGAVLRQENIENFKRNGIIFCLQATPEKIFERLKNDDTRPLLKVADPLAKIKEMLETRKPFYENNSYAIDTTKLSVKEIAKKIEALKPSTIRVNLKENSYNIYIGKPFAEVVNFLPGVKGRKILVVTDSNVEKLYLKDLLNVLKNKNYDAKSYIISAGEQYKNLDEINKIWKACVEHGLDRGSLIIALGGGVVGDMSGFAAATYLRGINVVQISTTLLAMVDASIGGKTGIDFEFGKNLVGAFHQPKLVWIDPIFLKTLDDREYKNGLAEVLKYAVINSPSSEWVSAGRGSIPLLQGCPQDGVALPFFRRGGSVADGVVLSSHINIKKLNDLPYNPELEKRAKELRKARNLSEVILWKALKNKQFLDLDFDRQRIIGNYIVDFYCHRFLLVIEIDGISHDNKEKYDKERDEFLKGLGLKVLHFRDKDIKKNLERVLGSIKNEVVDLWMKEELPRLSNSQSTPSEEGEFLEYLETNIDKILARNDNEILKKMLYICAQAKANVVSQDEKEGSLRKILNFGHTLGHAIETFEKFNGLKHGEAVALGMAFAVYMAVQMKLCDKSVETRLLNLLKKTGFEIKKWKKEKIFTEKYANFGSQNIMIDSIILIMSHDKKMSDGKIDFILPTSLGKVKIVPLELEIIKKMLIEWGK